MQSQKHFVYILRSMQDPTRYYAGLTSDVSQRLAIHNSGGSSHTASLRPWQVVASIEFSNQDSAMAFEKYLEDGIGTCLRQEALYLGAASAPKVRAE